MSAPTTAARPAYGTVELHGGDARVVMMPALGGRITELDAGGRQWLLAPPVAHGGPLPSDGGAYEDRFVGGYDECFPTRAACTLPHSGAPHVGLALPDHGELWSRPCDIEITTDADGQRAVCRWVGRRLPYRFERSVVLQPDGEIVMRYAVSNGGAVRLPFVWSADVVVPLGATTRIVLPDGVVTRVVRATGAELGGAGSEHRWPRFALPKRIVDLSRPASVGKRFSARVTMDLPSGGMSLHDGGARLDLAIESAFPAMLAVEIVRAPGSFLGRAAMSRLILSPGFGAPDSLAEALGAWHGAQWLEAGATRAWTLRWRGTREGAASGT